MDVEGAVESNHGSYGDEFAEEEEEDNNVEQSDAPPLLIARGGPLYTPNLVSPLTQVSEFEDSVLSALQSLKDELVFDSSEVCNQDDITVDDIRIISNEELVEMALKEVFKDGSENASCSNPSVLNQNDRVEGDHSTTSKMQTHSKTFGRKGGASVTSESNSETKSANNSNTRRGKNSRKKKGKGEEESYPAIVDELLSIKQKQDEDRRTATLHSLSVGCKVNKGSSASSESGTIMKSLRSVNSNMPLVKTSDITQEVPVQLPEVVLVVEVYHNVHQWQKTQEFLVLGRQLLTELKDKIYCKTDEIMKRAEHYDASGYFLIEDLFLNDMRENNGTDYSEPIFDWLNNSKEEVSKKWDYIIGGDLKRKHKALVGEMPNPSLPVFRRAEMQTMRFCDLKFQLGAPYLYCHQGDCKHSIVIRDMRLIHPEDAQNRAAYPIESFRLKVRWQKCSVCKLFRAKKVTVDDKLAKHNPCYFCDACYFLLHYKENNELLYHDFSVYNYIHD